VDKASDFFRGGLVAYQETVKRELLGVTADSVLSAQAAEQMARGVARLLGTQLAVSTTGVAGDTPEEGTPPGTVYIGISIDAHTTSSVHHFNGSPAEICDEAGHQALVQLLDVLQLQTPAMRDHQSRAPDAEFTFDHDLAAPRTARQTLRPLIGDEGNPIARAVETVASELVTNVVRHTDDGGIMRAWDPKTDLPFHLEVSDPDPTMPQLRETPGASGGFGMRIIDQMADAWGAEPTEHGKTIWAEFNRPGRQPDQTATEPNDDD
jgi:nicotinamide-nucleotide amidase